MSFFLLLILFKMCPKIWFLLLLISKHLAKKKIQILYPKGKMDAHIIHPFIHDRFDPIKLFFLDKKKILFNKIMICKIYFWKSTNQPSMNMDGKWKKERRKFFLWKSFFILRIIPANVTRWWKYTNGYKIDVFCPRFIILSRFVSSLKKILFSHHHHHLFFWVGGLLLLIIIKKTSSSFDER